MTKRNINKFIDLYFTEVKDSIITPESITIKNITIKKCALINKIKKFIKDCKSIRKVRNQTYIITGFGISWISKNTNFLKNRIFEESWATYTLYLNIFIDELLEGGIYAKCV